MRVFKEWVARLDAEEIRSNSSARAWAVTYPAWIFIIALGAWIPGTSEALALDPRPALWVMGAHLPVLIYHLAHFPRGVLSPRTVALLLMGSALLQVNLAALVACSGPLGGVVYGSLLMFTVLAHGRVFLCTWNAPWALLGPLSATAAGLLLGSGPANLAKFGALGVASVFGTLIIGTMARNSKDAAARERQLELALAAHQLEREQSNNRALERHVVDLLGANHDIKNVLSTTILNAASLRKALEAAGPLDPVLLEKMDKVQQALALVVAISRTSREAATSDSRPEDPVPLARALDAVRTRFSARWPDCTLCLPESQEELVLPGGSASLERILENLLINAAEGDGQRGARRVEVTTVAHGPWLRLTVEDDGPGFPPGQLGQDTAGGFHTTKRQGVGLGLVTVASLVAAARGELSRGNRAGGGARVEVVLPRLDVHAPVTSSSAAP